MSADATTTPSACSATVRAWSGVEMPKPMITGRSVTDLRRFASTIEASDTRPRDNCWWQLAPTPDAVAPVEYLLDFRIGQRLRGDAGLGLAWCRHASDCRVAFLWAVHGAEWGSHQPRTGLRAEQTGRAVDLAPGQHRLRVSGRGSIVALWLDGRQLLRRDAALDAAYLERPASVHLVVQNAAVTLVGEQPVAVIGKRP